MEPLFPVFGVGAEVEAPGDMGEGVACGVCDGAAVVREAVDEDADDAGLVVFSEGQDGRPTGACIGVITCDLDEHADGGVVTVLGEDLDRVATDHGTAIGPQSFRKFNAGLGLLRRECRKRRASDEGVVVALREHRESLCEPRPQLGVGNAAVSQLERGFPTDVGALTFQPVGSVFYRSR